MHCSLDPPADGAQRWSLPARLVLLAVVLVGRGRFVLDALLHQAAVFRGVQLANQPEAHVYPGADSLAGDERPVDDPPLVPDDGETSHALQLVLEGEVRRHPLARRDPGRVEEEDARAHARHPLGPLAELRQPFRHPAVLVEAPGALPARNEDDVEGGHVGVVPGVGRDDFHAVRASHGLAAFVAGDANRYGAVARPARVALVIEGRAGSAEYLEGPHGVELLEPVEEDDPDEVDLGHGRALVYVRVRLRGHGDGLVLSGDRAGDASVLVRFNAGPSARVQVLSRGREKCSHALPGRWHAVRPCPRLKREDSSNLGCPERAELEIHARDQASADCATAALPARDDRRD